MLRMLKLFIYFFKNRYNWIYISPDDVDHVIVGVAVKIEATRKENINIWMNFKTLTE